MFHTSGTLFLDLCRLISCNFRVSGAISAHPSLEHNTSVSSLATHGSFFVIYSLFKTFISQHRLFFLFFSWANLACFSRTNLLFLPHTFLSI